MKTIQAILILLLGFTYTVLSQNSYIQIVCEPNVSISLDGNKKGVTSVEVGGFILEGLTRGRHKVTLLKNGFIEQFGSVLLKDGEVYTYYSSPFIPQVSIDQVGSSGSLNLAADELEKVKTGNLKIQSVPIEIVVKINELGVESTKVDDQWFASNVQKGRYAVEYVWNTKLLRDTIEIFENRMTHVFVNLINNEVTNRSVWARNQKKVIAASVVPRSFTTQRVETKPIVTSGATANVEEVVEESVIESVETVMASPDMTVVPKSSNIDLVEMVTVPAGSFEMGAKRSGNDERPIHDVSVNSFQISKYEVTNDQYCAFLNEMKCSENGKYKDVLMCEPSLEGVNIEYVNGRFLSKQGKGYYPMVGVTWQGATEFCKWAGGRLPTEAEWEFAAKGGSEPGGTNYAGSGLFYKVGWGKGNSDGRVHMVGQKSPNELGIYDMSGNVIEWCADWYGENYYKKSEGENPLGPDAGTKKVARGGCYAFDNDNCEVSRRLAIEPNSYGGNAGFRLCKSSL